VLAKDWEMVRETAKVMDLATVLVLPRSIA